MGARILVQIRVKNNKEGCSLLVMRKQPEEACTHAYSNQDSDKYMVEYP